MLATVAYRPRQANINAPSGWTELDSFEQRDGNGNGNVQAIFYRTATESEPPGYTWGFTGNADYAVGGIISYSGVDTGSPFDVYDDTDNTTNFGTNHTADSITTTVDQARLVGVFSFNSSATWTTSDGMIERVDEWVPEREDAVGISLSIYDEIRPTAGSTGTRTAEASGEADAGIATLIALRPAQVDPGPGFCGPNSKFSDDFEDGTLGDWQLQAGQTDQTGVSDAYSARDGTFSLYTRAGAVAVRSPPIDLSGYASATLSFWVLSDPGSFFGFFPYDPDGAADLELWYRTKDNGWELVPGAEFPASDPAGTTRTPTYPDLPPDAFHENFQIEFRQQGGESVFGVPLDRWHIDDICVTATGSAGIDRFVLDHDEDAITCRPETVELRAYANGELATDYTGSVNLTTSTDNGDWSPSSANGDLTVGDDDSGNATYQFDPSDGGEVVLELANTHAETLVVNANAQNSTATDDGSQGSITFRPYGFELTPDPIPGQVAGRPFSLQLAAVGEVPSESGCSVIEEYDGNRDLAFWFDYEEPTSGSVQATIDGNPVATSETDASEQTINFTNGTAEVEADYRDAGEIQLHVKDDSGIGKPRDETGDEIVAGGTNAFVVRPHAFEVIVPNDPSESGSTGMVFRAAGEAFDTTVRAVVWGDDDNDGIPDKGDELSDNAATPNFGQEGEKVVLTSILAAPTTGSEGSLSNAIFENFSGGTQAKTRAADNGVSWDEVGYTDLNAALDGTDGYLGTGEEITGTAETIGRFIPHHFTLAQDDLTHRAALGCTGGSSFTYIGERFDSSFTLKARAAGGGTTMNYEGAYAALDSGSQLSVGAVDVDDGTDRSSSLTISGASFDWTAGASPVAAQLVFERSDPEGPYDLRIGIDATDSDGVTLAAGELDLDVDDDGSGEYGETTNMATAGYPATVRFGRLTVGNGAGSEVAPVALPVRAQYWDGGIWVRNTDDSCTALDLANQVRLSNAVDTSAQGDSDIVVNTDEYSEDGDDAAGTGETEILTLGPLTLSMGALDVRFAAPGAGNTGWVELTPMLSEDDPPKPDHSYLRYDWSTDDNLDGNLNDSPRGRATFGIYDGDDEWVHIRRIR